jgi:hypothetical protein
VDDSLSGLLLVMILTQIYLLALVRGIV